jgi:hypothetical protein
MTERFLQLERERTQLMPRVVSLRRVGCTPSRQRPRLHVATAISVLALCTTQFNCAEQSHSRDTGFAERDSAGIRIVENPFPPRGQRAWQFSESPVLDIGVLDGEDTYQLHRVCGAARLTDGTIIIGNGGTHELRWYDADGVYRKTVGGEGGGPGEFEYLQLLRLYRGDSLITWDPTARRVTVFDGGGSLGRVTPLNAFAVMRGVFADGSFFFEEFSQPTSDGLVRHPRILLRYGEDGAFSDTLGAFPGAEMVYEVEQGGRNRRVSGQSIPFARRAVYAPALTGFYAGLQNEYQIDLYDLTGSWTASVRLLKDLVPVDDEALELWNRVRAARAASRGVQREPRALPHAETKPAYSNIFVDDEGNLWVKEYGWSGNPNRRWTVFDRSHRVLAQVEMPDGFRVYQIGADFALGIWRDEFDVEHVRLYGLMKP